MTGVDKRIWSAVAVGSMLLFLSGIFFEKIWTRIFKWHKVKAVFAEFFFSSYAAIIRHGLLFVVERYFG